MKKVTIYKCRLCKYKITEIDGQIPMNFMLTCPRCGVRLKKYVLGLQNTTQK